MAEPLQVVYFPYLALFGVDELEFAGLRVWNSERLEIEVGDREVRSRLKILLESHRLPAGDPSRSSPVTDMGIVSKETADLRPFEEPDREEIQDLRCALFLTCLAQNVRQHGANAGHSIYTAENFSLVTHKFDLDRDSFAETTGALVQMTHLGYRLGQIQFPTPSYVPRPMRFRHDDALWSALEFLQKSNLMLYRRLIRAAALFIESYYNTTSVDLAARVLLQAAAFEVLLDLPEGQGRKALKDEVERLCNNEDDEQVEYEFEVYGKMRQERRSLKGMWADRFYTLRNHLIHGQEISLSEYRFQGAQHHVLIAPMMFVMCLKGLLMQQRGSLPELPLFFERIDWADPEEDDDEDEPGFRVDTDWGAYVQHRVTEGGLFE